MTERALLAIALLALAAPGCVRGPGRVPASIVGRTCASCGMEIRDAHYAAAWVAAERLRPFDSIECALREARDAREARDLYLADYKTGALHRSDSLWVVRAKIPSPMGAGLAAFLDRAEAERIASARDGTVLPTAALLLEPRGAR